MAIEKMSANLLLSSTVAAEEFPKEATFQHLMLTAIAKCTTADIAILPELSKTINS